MITTCGLAGALKPEEKDLFKGHLDRVEAVLTGENPPPYEIEIQPTSRCNLDCKHCFAKKLTCKRIQDRIGIPEMHVLINKISEFHNNGFGVDVVKFCGTTGEPLVNPATVYGIELAKEHGKNVILFTNGLFLDKKTEDGRLYLDHLLNANKINLSFDAASKETFYRLKGVDGFDRIVGGLETLAEKRDRYKKNLNLTTSYVIGKLNYKEVVEFARLMREVGVNEVKYRVDFTDLKSIRRLSGRIIEDLKKAQDYPSNGFKVTSVYSKEEIKNNGSAFEPTPKCFNRFFWACVAPNGDLYDCGHRTYYGVPSYGNLLDNDFGELWNSSKRLEKRIPDNYCKFCSPTSCQRNKIMKRLAENGIS